MLFNWDGTGTGETNLPNGIYYYYISAETNGGSSDVVVGGSSGGSSPPSPAFASGLSSLSAAPSELLAAPADGSGPVVPFALYPPGIDTNNLVIFEGSPANFMPKRASDAQTQSFAAIDSGGNATPDNSVTPSQPAPPAPQRPPYNPVRGFAGTFGIGYDTYTGNGTNGATTRPLQNEPGITGSYIQMQTIPAGNNITWGPRPEHISEANSFVQTMQHFGWSNPLNLVDGYLNISALRGSGTPFNNVNMGVLILHAAYGSTQDYMAGLCKQMYFPIAQGSTAQYLRLSEMNLGGAGTNGLKWMVIDACHSLYHVNWSTMQNQGIYPYNGNLHLLLGGDTDTYCSPHWWWLFGEYMNYGTSPKVGNYNPLTIREAWYQSAHDAFTNLEFPHYGTYHNPCCRRGQCLS